MTKCFCVCGHLLPEPITKGKEGVNFYQYWRTVYCWWQIKIWNKSWVSWESSLFQVFLYFVLTWFCTECAFGAFLAPSALWKVIVLAHFLFFTIFIFHKYFRTIINFEMIEKLDYRIFYLAILVSWAACMNYAYGPTATLLSNCTLFFKIETCVALRSYASNTFCAMI